MQDIVSFHHYITAYYSNMQSIVKSETFYDFYIYVCVCVFLKVLCVGVWVHQWSREREGMSSLGADSCEAGLGESSSICSGSVSHNHRT